MLLQFTHLALASAAAFYLTGKLKWKKVASVRVRGIDGIGTAFVSLLFGTGAVWVLGWGAGLLGVHSGLNWLVGGLASYTVCGFVHELAKPKPGEHTKPA